MADVRPGMGWDCCGNGGRGCSFMALLTRNMRVQLPFNGRADGRFRGIRQNVSINRVASAVLERRPMRMRRRANVRRQLLRVIRPVVLPADAAAVPPTP